MSVELSRAERVLLSNIKREVLGAITTVERLSRVIGAIPDNDQIDQGRSESLRALRGMMDSIHARRGRSPLAPPKSTKEG